MFIELCYSEINGTLPNNYFTNRFKAANAISILRVNIVFVIFMFINQNYFNIFINQININ